MGDDVCPIEFYSTLIGKPDPPPRPNFAQRIVSSHFDPTPLEALDRAFTHESMTADDGRFCERVSVSLDRVLTSYETRWRSSLALDESVLRHDTATIRSALTDMCESNPGGVHTLTLHWFVGLNFAATAEHLDR